MVSAQDQHTAAGDVSKSSTISVRKNSTATLSHWQTIDESSSDDEDEILWMGNELDSDEDFVLIPHMRSALKPAPATRYDEVTRGVIQGIASLSFPPAKNDSNLVNAFEKQSTTPKIKGAKEDGSRSMPRTSVAASVQQNERARTKARGSRGKQGKRCKKERHVEKEKVGVPKSALNPTSPGTVFNVTESRSSSSPSVESDGEVDAKYENAVSFITSFLQTSAAAFHASQGTRLTFLQSLIIELGLMSPNSTLPASLTSATRFLKTHAFLNLRDYLSVRHEGIGKLQEIMFQNRRALVHDLRKSKGRRQLDRTWVKDHGLTVFLVRT